MSDQSALPDPLSELARTRLGVMYIYPIQRFVISNTLEGKSQIVVLPTGAGKSLCFQLPSLLLPRATLVIVPLLSLMADQLRRLRQLNVGASVLRGGLSSKERQDLFTGVQRGKIPLVLATPESCQLEANLAQLRACRFSHLVVDEAHCIPEWGETFRPAYRDIGAVARALEIPTRTAFTATASEAVIARIRELLFGDGEVRLVSAAPDRPNIFYSVRRVLSLEHELEGLVRGATRPLVAFFRTRNGTEVAARAMRRRLADERVRFYHAGLSREERADVEKWFLDSRDGVLFATCAYGLGVDKPDIRTVVHAGVPGSVEAYLQETGRAGRDGKPSAAILLVSREDRGFTAGIVDGPGRQRYENILGYALSRAVCRRETLLALIGARSVACSGCDVCAGMELRASPGAEEICAFVRRSPRRFSVQQAAEILSSSLGPRPMRRFHDCIRGYGALGGWDKVDVEAALRELVIEGSVAVVARGPWKRTLVTGRRARPPPLHREAHS